MLLLRVAAVRGKVGYYPIAPMQDPCSVAMSREKALPPERGIRSPPTMHRELKNPFPVRMKPGPSPAEAAAVEVHPLRSELALQEEQYLRLAADFENFKRRSRIESEDRAGAQKRSFIPEVNYLENQTEFCHAS